MGIIENNKHILYVYNDGFPNLRVLKMSKMLHSKFQKKSFLSESNFVLRNKNTFTHDEFSYYFWSDKFLDKAIAKVKRTISFKSIISNDKIGIGYKKALNYLSPNMIHYGGLSRAEDAARLAQSYGVPFVLDLHENYPYNLWSTNRDYKLNSRLYSLDTWLEYEKKSVSIADSVIVTCQEMKSRLIGMHGVNPNKIFPVHNTEDPSDWNNDEFPIRKNKMLDKEAISLIYGGSCSLHRGLDVAIHGMAQLVKEFPNISLDIIGDGPGIKVWKEMVVDLGLRNHVKFHGYLPFTKLKEMMVLADIGIIPHHKYGQTDNTIPHKLYQHFGAALPSLVSSCHSLQNAMVQTGAGKVFNAGDPKDFVRITIEMIQDLHYRSNLSENSKRALYEGEYSWQTSARNLNDAYSFATSGKNLRAI